MIFFHGNCSCNIWTYVSCPFSILNGRTQQKVSTNNGANKISRSERCPKIVHAYFESS